MPLLLVSFRQWEHRTNDMPTLSWAGVCLEEFLCCWVSLSRKRWLYRMEFFC
jgi:hypothetical protein